MATNQTQVMTSHNLPNFSGLLFNKGNTATPFCTLIGGKSRNTDSWEYVMSQEYDTDESLSQPAITETASLTAPDPDFVSRSQNTNVVQIFQETLQISYGKQSAKGQLSGLNIAGQEPNPATELDFQTAQKMIKIANKIEYSFLNGSYQKGTHDDVAYKTRGIIQAITTNTKAAGGTGLSYWLIAELIQLMSDHNAPTHNLVLMARGVHIMQINADATANGLTVIPAAREINGIKLDTIVTPFGSVSLLPNPKVPAGTVVFVNPEVCCPVYMPVPGKGNFFREELAKVGASDKYQIYGQAGLDYGIELYHAKITGLDTTFTAPTYSRKVFVAGGSLTTAATQAAAVKG